MPSEPQGLSPDQLERLDEVCDAALGLPESRREPYINEACEDDPAVRAEALTLVRRAGLTESASTQDLSRPALEVETHPDRIGRYKIRRVIATGGMGTVYEAVQENPRRTVALKVMKRGIASRSALRRFEYEAQILGRLRHPGVAQIFEAGTHDDGSGPVPFFAMEYVPAAKTLLEFAEVKKLGTREKLALFARVCDAVHHGHQKGIIHRDLKPGNILVDSSGQPKVIDFGVARCTDSDMAVTTLQTDVGQLIGTLQYMSPEQCDADPHDLDTRSDVYALGVVLYELLCGRLPYEVSRVAIHEAARVIRETQPERPSTINRALRGDVETITLKALEKERERRYRSASDLGDDIARYLNSEPIEARPASAMYQIQMFARRNRTGVTAAVVVALVLLGATVVSTLQWRATESALATADFRLREFQRERVEWVISQQDMFRTIRGIQEWQSVLPGEMPTYFFDEELRPRAGEWFREEFPDLYGLDRQLITALSLLHYAVDGDERLDQARRWVLEHAEQTRRIVDESSRRALDFSHMDFERDTLQVWNIALTDIIEMRMLARRLCELAVIEHQRGEVRAASDALRVVRRAARSAGDVPLLMGAGYEHRTRQELSATIASLATNAAANNKDPSVYIRFVAGDAPVPSLWSHLLVEVDGLRADILVLFAPRSLGGEPRLDKDRAVDLINLHSNSEVGFLFAEQGILEQVTFDETMGIFDAFLVDFENADDLNFADLANLGQRWNDSGRFARDWQLILSLENEVSPMSYFLPNASHAYASRRRTELWRDGAICAVAIAEHRYAHGEWPDSLADTLVGRKQQPLRMEYWGRPFTYAIVDDEPVLYAGTLPDTASDIQDDFSGDTWEIILAPKSWRRAMIDLNVEPRDD